MQKKYEEVLSAIAEMQQDGDELPCPRCGHEMAVPLVRNALSRHANVHICSVCGMDEAVRDIGGNVLPIENWAFTGMLDEGDLNADSDDSEADEDAVKSRLDDAEHLDKLNTALWDRMILEQQAFTEQLLRKSPAEILQAAYEYVIREDIVLAVENNNLDLEEVQAMLALEHPLAAAYEKWYYEDIGETSSHMEEIWNAVCAAAEDAASGNVESDDHA